MNRDSAHELGSADQAPSAAPATHERLRLIHLFLWMTAVALSIQGSAWLDRIVGVDDSPRPFLETTWAAVTFGTALCSVPWLLERRFRRTLTELQPGARLWVLLAPVACLRAWAVYGIPLLFTPYLEENLESLLRAYGAVGVMGCLATLVLVVVAARARQAARWRVFHCALALSLLLDAAAYACLMVSDADDAYSSVLFFFFVVGYGCTMLLPFPVLLYTVARDIMSAERTHYRWSHWVGVSVYVSAVCFIIVFHGATLVSTMPSLSE
jgi:hypothetical protein